MVLLSVSSVFSQWCQWFDPAGLARFDEMMQRGELEMVCKEGGKRDEAKTH